MAEESPKLPFGNRPGCGYGAYMQELVRTLGNILVERGQFLVTAESCTGGLISAALTGAEGSSAWFKGGVVAYANEVKTRLLWVPEPLMIEYGAVSRPVVMAMAEGACNVLNAPVSLAVTGVAGPGGGTPDKPVGTVWFAWRGPRMSATEEHLFLGNRDEVREQTVQRAIEGLLERLR